MPTEKKGSNLPFETRAEKEIARINRFIDTLKKNAPYPLDDFPDASEAQQLLAPYGFDIQSFVDEPELYILTALKQK